MMTPRLLLPIAAMLLSCAMLGSCGGDPTGVLPEGLALSSGDEQSGVAGQPLPQPLVVTVADGSGRAVEGARIRWEVISGGGTIPLFTYADAGGRASAMWYLGVVGRTQTARASVSTVADSSGSSTPVLGSSTPVTFTATANGAATGLVLIVGNSQAAIIDDTLPVPLRVRATNEAGAGVTGVPVIWTTTGDGAVSADSTVTDAQGEALVTWVLGPTVGAQTATATVPGLSSAPLTFTAMATPAANTLTWATKQLPAGNYIWASSPTDVWVVGGGGTIRHFNGASWELLTSGTTSDLRVVWGNSASDVYAGGNGGTILHYDGASWTPVAGTPSDAIYSIWTSSPNDVFAVGHTGLWHSDGSVWTKQVDTPSSPGNCPLTAVWGSSGRDVWAIGHVRLHYDGTTWGSVPRILCSYTSWTGVRGSGPSDVFFIGTDISFNGCTRGGGCPYVGFIYQYDGTSWQSKLSMREYGYAFNDVWVASSAEVVVVGANGLILHSDGTRWRRESSGTTQSIVAVTGSSARDVWAITSSGLVLHGTR